MTFVSVSFVFLWGMMIALSRGAENIHEYTISHNMNNNNNNPNTNNNNNNHNNNQHQSHNGHQHRNNEVPAMLSSMWGGPTSRLEMPQLNRSAYPPLPLTMMTDPQPQIQLPDQGQGQGHDDMRPIDNSDNGKTLFFENPTSGNRPQSSAKQDAIINKMWGGQCKMDHWLKCNNIRTVTGDFFNKEILDHFEMDCNDETEFPWICMKNGWTVNRCHLLCMSGCNRDILLTRNYDNYVSHEGRCPPVSKKG